MQKVLQRCTTACLVAVLWSLSGAGVFAQILVGEPVLVTARLAPTPESGGVTDFSGDTHLETNGSEGLCCGVDPDSDQFVSECPHATPFSVGETIWINTYWVETLIDDGTGQVVTPWEVTFDSGVQRVSPDPTSPVFQLFDDDILDFTPFLPPDAAPGDSIAFCFGIMIDVPEGTRGGVITHRVEATTPDNFLAEKILTAFVVEP